MVKMKCSIGKSILAVNLPLELFRTAVANAGRLTSLHIFLSKCLYHEILVKFEQNCMVQTTQNFELLRQKLYLKTKNKTKKQYLTKRRCHLGRRFCS